MRTIKNFILFIGITFMIISGKGNSDNSSKEVKIELESSDNGGFRNISKKYKRDSNNFFMKKTLAVNSK